MTHEDYIKLAIEAAKESEQEGGAPIAALVVKDGEIIAKGKSLVSQIKDPSGHGECNAIRAACKELGAVDLDGCILYGTLEPCGMCLSCAAWANLSELYFGAYRSDVPENSYEIENWNAEEASKSYKPWGGKSMKVTGGILREECRQLLEGYRDWHK